MRHSVVFLMAAVFGYCAWGADRLQAIKAESSPEKRYERAIENMDVGLKNAQEVIKNGGTTRELDAELEDMAGSAELALQSLRDTGKKPKKMTRQYKKGELRTSDAVRRMNSMIQALSVENRPIAEKALDRLKAVQEEFLRGVMDRS